MIAHATVSIIQVVNSRKIPVFSFSATSALKCHECAWGVDNNGVETGDLDCKDPFGVDFTTECATGVEYCSVCVKGEHQFTWRTKIHTQ